MQIAEALLSLHQAANTLELAVDQVVDRLAKTISPAKQRTTQLNHLVNYFIAHAYDCRWEAHEEGPCIIFRNCPYDAILTGHPELCQLDLGIIEKYLGMQFQQVGKKGSNSKPSTCIFLAAR